ncbi:biogenesis of lysosome-related organelles complex 1 subunit 5 [Discoglossus pictus]
MSSSPAKIPSLKPRDHLSSMGQSAQLIIKDVGEIHSRLLDHRPVIQGETRYFMKEFEEKRGFREMRVLENVKSSISETNEQTLPKCTDVMQDQLGAVLKTLEAANQKIRKLQQREQENAKKYAVKVNEEKLRAQWELFMKEQEQRRLEVNEEHRKAVERLKEQYKEMDKDLSKMASY